MKCAYCGTGEVREKTNCPNCGAPYPVRKFEGNFGEYINTGVGRHAEIMMALLNPPEKDPRRREMQQLAAYYAQAIRASDNPAWRRR